MLCLAPQDNVNESEQGKRLKEIIGGESIQETRDLPGVVSGPAPSFEAAKDEPEETGEDWRTRKSDKPNHAEPEDPNGSSESYDEKSNNEESEEYEDEYVNNGEEDEPEQEEEQQDSKGDDEEADIFSSISLASERLKLMGMSTEDMERFNQEEMNFRLVLQLDPRYRASLKNSYLGISINCVNIQPKGCALGTGIL